MATSQEQQLAQQQIAQTQAQIARQRTEIARAEQQGQAARKAALYTPAQLLQASQQGAGMQAALKQQERQGVVQRFLRQVAGVKSQFEPQAQQAEQDISKYQGDVIQYEKDLAEYNKQVAQQQEAQALYDKQLREFTAQTGMTPEAYEAETAKIERYNQMVGKLEKAASKGQLWMYTAFGDPEEKHLARKMMDAGWPVSKMQMEKRFAEGVAYRKQLSEMKDLGIKPVYVKGQLTGFEDVTKQMSVPLSTFPQFIEKYRAVDIPKFEKAGLITSVAPLPDYASWASKYPEKGYETLLPQIKTPALPSTPTEKLASYVDSGSKMSLKESRAFNILPVTPPVSAIMPQTLPEKIRSSVLRRTGIDLPITKARVFEEYVGATAPFQGMESALTPRSKLGYVGQIASAGLAVPFRTLGGAIDIGLEKAKVPYNLRSFQFNYRAPVKEDIIFPARLIANPIISFGPKITQRYSTGTQIGPDISAGQVAKFGAELYAWQKLPIKAATALGLYFGGESAIESYKTFKTPIPEGLTPEQQREFKQQKYLIGGLQAGASALFFGVEGYKGVKLARTPVFFENIILPSKSEVLAAKKSGEIISGGIETGVTTKGRKAINDLARWFGAKEDIVQPLIRGSGKADVYTDKLMSSVMFGDVTSEKFVKSIEKRAGLKQGTLLKNIEYIEPFIIKSPGAYKAVGVGITEEGLKILDKTRRLPSGEIIDVTKGYTDKLEQLKKAIRESSVMTKEGKVASIDMAKLEKQKQALERIQMNLEGSKKESEKFIADYLSGRLSTRDVAVRISAGDYQAREIQKVIDRLVSKSMPGKFELIQRNIYANLPITKAPKEIVVYRKGEVPWGMRGLKPLKVGPSFYIEQSAQYNRGIVRSYGKIYDITTKGLIPRKETLLKTEDLIGGKSLWQEISARPYAGKKSVREFLVTGGKATPEEIRNVRKFMKQENIKDIFTAEKLTQKQLDKLGYRFSKSEVVELLPKRTITAAKIEKASRKAFEIPIEGKGANKLLIRESPRRGSIEKARLQEIRETFALGSKGFKYAKGKPQTIFTEDIISLGKEKMLEPRVTLKMKGPVTTSTTELIKRQARGQVAQGISFTGEIPRSEIPSKPSKAFKPIKFKETPRYSELKMKEAEAFSKRTQLINQKESLVKEFGKKRYDEVYSQVQKDYRKVESELNKFKKSNPDIVRQEKKDWARLNRGARKAETTRITSDELSGMPRMVGGKGTETSGTQDLFMEYGPRQIMEGRIAFERGTPVVPFTGFKEVKISSVAMKIPEIKTIGFIPSQMKIGKIDTQFKSKVMPQRVIKVTQIPQIKSKESIESKIKTIQSPQIKMLQTPQMDIGLVSSPQLKMNLIQTPQMEMQMRMQQQMQMKQEMRMQQKLQQRIQQQMAQRPLIISPPRPPRPRPPTPKPPRKWEEDFGGGFAYGRKYAPKLAPSKEPGFSFQVKSRKKFGAVAPISVSKETAFALGARAVRAKAAATFKIVPTKRAAMPMAIKPTAFDVALFRKGKRPGEFVQKERLRILSPGEKKEISYVGIAARRAGGRRKLSGF